MREQRFPAVIEKSLREDSLCISTTQVCLIVAEAVHMLRVVWRAAQCSLASRDTRHRFPLSSSTSAGTRASASLYPWSASEIYEGEQNRQGACRHGMLARKQRLEYRLLFHPSQERLPCRFTKRATSAF